MANDPSIITGTVKTFTTTDYVIFSILLAINAAIGLFYAIKDQIKKKNNTTEYLLGGRNMSPIPIALSLAVTFLSAVTLLGTPVEMVKFNTMFMYLALGMLLACLFAGLVFIPFFYRLELTSTFQYLELRFSYPVRLLGSFLLIIQMLIYMAFVLYAPSLALSAVTKMDFDVCVAGIGLVVTFYTTLGGMKAVIWTDSYQFLIILAGLLAIFIKGSMEAGGFSEAWDKAEEKGRVVFDDFSFDPSTRHSFWSVVIGGGFFWMSLYGVNQAQVQRCMAARSLGMSQLAILINTPVLVFLSILACLIGIVMYSFYSDCDPVNAKLITKRDQMLPLFVLDVLGHLHGLPGVFVSCIFSGSLSTMSSGLNAIATVCYKDFLQTIVCKKLSESHATIVNKILCVVFGGAMIGLAYLVAELGTLQQASMTVYGILNGPIFGLFVLGMFFPWANAIGAFVGCLTSVAFMGWIGIGAYVNKVSTAKPSKFSVAGCGEWYLNATIITEDFNTTSKANNISTSSSDSGWEGVEKVYTLSYLYYTLTGMLVVVIVGLIVSFLTCYTKPSSLDARLICPFFDNLLPCLPECILRPLRCGINHNRKYEKTDDLGLDDVVPNLQVAYPNQDKERHFFSKKGEYNFGYKN